MIFDNVCCLGFFRYRFDLVNCNVNNDHFENLNRDNISEVILVKKMYAEKSVRNRRRRFKLRHLDADGMDVTSVNRDYTDFLEDLEEDPAFRQNVNIYKDASRMQVESSEVGEEIPQITLQEMLEDLRIDDATADDSALAAGSSLMS